MQQPPLPTGCHTVQSAALLLGVSEKSLYKKLREIGWVFSGTFKEDPAHNMPRRAACLAGFLTTAQRGYAAPYNKNVTIIYNITIITQRGFNELKHMQNQQQTQPIVKPLTLENAQRTQAQIPSPAANEEREKAMQQMREWGIAS